MVVLLAASSPSPLWAGTIMAAFGVGSLPALLLTQWTWKEVGKYRTLQKGFGLILLLLGLLTVQQRIEMTEKSPTETYESKLFCH